MANHMNNNENFVFNGSDFKYNIEEQGWTFIINATRGRGIFGKELHTKKVVGVDGATVLDSSLPSRTIEVDYTLKAAGLEDLRQAESYITVLLQHKDISSLSFSDQRGYYEAYFESIDVTYEDDKVQQGTITFFCPKPFRYKGLLTAFEDKQMQANKSEVVDTESNYYSMPIFELTVNEPSAVISVTAGDTVISYKSEKIVRGDVIVIDSEKMEVRHNGALKVLEVDGSFPTLSTTYNAIKVNIDCTLTLKYSGVDV